MSKSSTNGEVQIAAQSVKVSGTSEASSLSDSLAYTQAGSGNYVSAEDE